MGQATAAEIEFVGSVSKENGKEGCDTQGN